MISKNRVPKKQDGAERLKEIVDPQIAGVQGDDDRRDDLPQEKGDADKAVDKRDAGKTA